ncbi:MAG: glycerol-3-phosphate 1-O-acyltransferase PlsY [Rhodospirillales bacterium]|nr:glycerol-3-phosphate 1-O-acyltransferase PlsY [Alphaproteobacteria bacterium]USO03741.1 MAG: glycerol-3-phosphate 1-O-acyltransferase PlsY [Rhodospirillales bacterium]
MELFFSALFGYLLGSIPFGLVLARLGGYGDIREIGSGNIGATNVLRTGSKPLALATLLLDSGKGAIAVLMTLYFIDFNAAMLAGFGAILGHLFPVWLKFKGGKGVATALGTLVALAPYIGLSACGLWLLTALVFRISSLSALVAIGFTPLIAHILYDDANLSGLCALIAALVYLKHRANIKRLFKGDEPKIGKKK